MSRKLAPPSLPNADSQRKSTISSDTPPADPHAPNPARRRFLQSTATAAAITAVPLSSRAETPYAAQLTQAATGGNGQAFVADARHSHPDTSAGFAAGNAVQSVKLNINGRPFELHLEARVTLLDALREYAGLTGTKKGCDRGQCGACTVISNGRRINACLSLAVMHDGGNITTVEGLAENHIPSALQQAFIEHDAFQCGFCTPGQLCSATALIEEYRAGNASTVTQNIRLVRDASPSQSLASLPALSDQEIRERMSGNLCRCGAYPNIVSAIRAVATQKV